METIKTKVLVIGGGPGGYVAAIRAGQLGLNVVLVERAHLGGTCLNIGCIPSKSLIHVSHAFHEAKMQERASPFGLRVSDTSLDFAAAVRWKDSVVDRLCGGVAGLLKKQRITTLNGIAVIEGGKSCIVTTDAGKVRVDADHLVLATGSVPMELTSLPFGGAVISSTDALSLAEVPARLVVVGAGYIGIELGMMFAKLESAVTIVEAADRILPAWDAELTSPVAKRLEMLGVKVITGALVQGLSNDDGQLSLRYQADEQLAAVPCDKILVAVGRKPCVDGFGLERLDLTMNDHWVKIDDCCATSMRNVWAIGDLTGEPMLAHRAMAQGKVVAERIAGQRVAFDITAIPAVCFSDPEIVSVGLSPDDAPANDIPFIVSKFPFLANGRALSQDDTAGFIRVVADANTHRVVGIQAVGHGVSELCAAFGLAIEMGALLEDIAGIVHAHPTRGEALHEAALGGLGHSLHL